ncbi:MAG: diguanylate cyclase, partial [Pirellulales bacterium]|nr:diguanylate cyclase [Pirellulales bacterium]
MRIAGCEQDGDARGLRFREEFHHKAEATVLTYLLLLIFAGANVALGWAAANWIARRTESEQEPVEWETASFVASSPEESSPPPESQAKPAEAEPASSLEEPESVEGLPEEDDAEDEEASCEAVDPSAMRDDGPEQADPTPEEEPPQEDTPTNELAFDATIGHVAEECELTQAISGVLTLDVESFRSQLLAAEQAYQAENADEDSLSEALEMSKSAIESWMAEQQAACTQMESLPEGAGQVSDRGVPIDELLKQATDRLESGCQKVLSVEGDAAENSSKVRREIIGLVDSCHNLRDAIQVGFATVTKKSEKLEINPQLREDVSTGLANYAGLENAIAEWWDSDDQNGVAATLMAVDVDGMAQINQQIGTRLCDQLLREIGVIIKNSLRRDRGFDYAARVGGQRFAVLVGYTTPRQATHALERIRQIIEASEFRSSTDTCTVTASCAATALKKNMSLDKHLDRLAQSLEFAKERGGNCTALWHDNESTLIEGIAYEIEGRKVELTANEGEASLSELGAETEDKPESTSEKTDAEQQAESPTEPTDAAVEQQDATSEPTAVESTESLSEDSSEVTDEGKANIPADSSEANQDHETAGQANDLDDAVDETVGLEETGEEQVHETNASEEAVDPAESALEESAMGEADAADSESVIDEIVAEGEPAEEQAQEVGTEEESPAQVESELKEPVLDEAETTGSE